MSETRYYLTMACSMILFDAVVFTVAWFTLLPALAGGHPESATYQVLSGSVGIGIGLLGIFFGIWLAVTVDRCH